jgi:hypothetical protein
LYWRFCIAFYPLLGPRMLYSTFWYHTASLQKDARSFPNYRKKVITCHEDP